MVARPGFEREERAFMNIACLMMQKNEGPLLQSWVDHHTKIFGSENIFIYDNGSTDEATIEILAKASEQGVNVEYGYSTRKDFEDKGNIFTAKIHELELLNKYDFFFPLDGDEFLSVQLPSGGLSVDPFSIKSTLEPYKKSPDVLMIDSEYNNNPMARDYYKQRDVQRKCFFASGACLLLDMGYHNAKAKTSSVEVRTPIVYIHFHNKSYDSYQRSAREKMKGRVADFSEETLRAHLADRKIGFHVIPALLKSRKEYEAGFSVSEHVYFPDLRLSIANNRFFDGFSLKPAKGLIESLERTINGVEIKGWAVTDSGQRVDGIKIFADGVQLNSLTVEYVSRKDVLKSGMSVVESCGFHIVVHAGSFNLESIKVIAVCDGEDRQINR